MLGVMLATKRLLRSLFVILACAVLLAGCGDGTSSGTGTSGTGSPGTADAKKVKPKIGFVTNCVDPFWTIAEKGCAAAAA